MILAEPHPQGGMGSESVYSLEFVPRPHVVSFWSPAEKFEAISLGPIYNPTHIGMFYGYVVHGHDTLFYSQYTNKNVKK